MTEGWYLAGPMSGYPQFNFPAFDAAAWGLRARGYTIINPAEEDPPEIQQLARLSKTGDPADLKAGPDIWAERLAHDVKLISSELCDGLILLPGWEDSRGACLECSVALLHGKAFMEWDGRNASYVDARHVIAGVKEKFEEVCRVNW